MSTKQTRRLAKMPRSRDFSARGDRCPICKRRFRDQQACPHSITQACDRLEVDYIRAVVAGGESDG